MAVGERQGRRQTRPAAAARGPTAAARGPPRSRATGRRVGAAGGGGPASRLGAGAAPWEGRRHKAVGSETNLVMVGGGGEKRRGRGMMAL
jgi:hypothetical protein